MLFPDRVSSIIEAAKIPEGCGVSSDWISSVGLQARWYGPVELEAQEPGGLAIAMEVNR